MRRLSDSRLYSETEYCLSYLRSLEVAAQPPGEPVLFHTYWYGEFGAKQALSLKSFVAHHDPGTYRFRVWLDGDNGPQASGFLDPLREMVEVERYDPVEASAGTPLEPRAGWAALFDRRRRRILSDRTDLVHRADIFRLLTMYRYGGLYFDLDVLCLRPWTPLFAVTKQEDFCYQWSGQPYANTAVSSFRPQSRVALYAMEKGLEGGRLSPWEVFLFDDPRIDLLVLPSPFFDPLWLHFDGHDTYHHAPFSTFAEFFQRRRGPFDPDRFFPGSFAYHWHNQWKAPERADSWAGAFDEHLSAILRTRYGITCMEAFTE